MSKKKWLSIGLLILISSAIINLNHIYIILYRPWVFPYPPVEAIKNEDIVIYGENPNPEVNAEKIWQFVDSFEKRQRATVTITFYEEDLNLFSKYFITTPTKKLILDYKGENDIVLSDVSSDMITQQAYQDIRVIDTGGYQIFRLIDEKNKGELDVLTIPTSN
jgi:hypothetical protein